MYILNTEFFGYIIKDRFTDVNEAAGKFFEFKLSTLGELHHFTAACCMHVETHNKFIVCILYIQCMYTIAG